MDEEGRGARRAVAVIVVLGASLFVTRQLWSRSGRDSLVLSGRRGLPSPRPARSEDVEESAERRPETPAPPGGAEARRVDRLVYHALHKTGSTSTRQGLRKHCQRHHLRCLTYRLCHAPPAPNPVQCAAKLAQGGLRPEGKERMVDVGSLTAFRLSPEGGCCPALGKHLPLDMLVEHFPLNDAANRAWLADHFPPGTFRFTVLRDPVQQFLSYEHQVRTDAPYRAFWHPPDLEAGVKLAERGLRDASKLTERERDWVSMVTNVQCKELGMPLAAPTNAAAEQSLRTLDLVGLFERLEETWDRLAARLHWPRDTFPARRGGKAHKVATELAARIRLVQHHDVALYRLAQQIFHASAPLKP